MKIRIGENKYADIDPRLITLSSIHCYKEESKAYGYFLFFEFLYSGVKRYAMLTLEESRTFEQDIIQEILRLNR